MSPRPRTAAEHDVRLSYGDSAALFLSLPDDVLALISSRLLPRDLSSLSLASRSLHSSITFSDKAWLAQCLNSPRCPPQETIVRWRSRVDSYRSLCRFLRSAAPLVGVWVHQNPELGNVVVSFFSAAAAAPAIVGLRVIPQELVGPFPVHVSTTSLLYSTVFEIFPDVTGRPSIILLHGGSNSVSIGSISAVNSSANVLLLEIDAGTDQAFSKLAFSDRRKLLELVAEKARVKLPEHLASPPLFFNHFSNFDELVEERIETLVNLCELHSGGRIDRKMVEFLLESMVNNAKNDSDSNGSNNAKMGRSLSSVAGYFRNGLKQFIRRSNSMNETPPSTSLRSKKGDSKHIRWKEFLQAGETVNLSLRAVHMKLSTYRAWPNMPDNRFALYKLPINNSDVGQEYSGIWGGTFGWPPGRPSEDKPGKALFLVLISYEEVDGELVLIATKILEGTHYVLHPNGSAMFVVKVKEATLEPFPWECDEDSVPVEVEFSYSGEGISSGYGFRYPGSKPGSLFVMQNGLIAFVWKESKAVLTLQRLDLEELLKNGERVPGVAPVANFAYLTKSYSNIYATYSSNSISSSSSRFDL